MAEFNAGQRLSLEAENAITEAFVAVELGTGDNQCDVPDTANEQAIGIAQYTAESGESVEVMVSGVTKVVAASAFSKNDKLSVAVGGRVQKAVDPTTTWTGTAASVENIIGIALEAADEAGQIVSMLIAHIVVVH